MPFCTVVRSYLLCFIFCCLLRKLFRYYA